MNSSGSPKRNDHDNKRKREGDASTSPKSPRKIIMPVTVLKSKQNLIVEKVSQLSGKFFRVVNTLSIAKATTEALKEYNTLIADDARSLKNDNASTRFHVFSKKIDYLLALQAKNTQANAADNIFILKIIKLLLREILEIRFAGCTSETAELSQPELTTYLANKATAILAELDLLHKEYDGDEDTLSDVLPKERSFVRQLRNVIAGKSITDGMIVSNSSDSASPVEAEVNTAQPSTVINIPAMAMQLALRGSNPRTVPVLSGMMDEYSSLMQQLKEAESQGQAYKRHAKQGIEHLKQRTTHYAASLEFMKQLSVLARVTDISSLEIDTHGVIVTSEEIEAFSQTQDAKVFKEQFEAVEESLLAEDQLLAAMEDRLIARAAHVKAELAKQAEAIPLSLLGEIDGILTQSQKDDAANINVRAFDPRLFGSLRASYQSYQAQQATLAAQEVRNKQLEEQLATAKAALNTAIQQTDAELKAALSHQADYDQLLKEAEMITTRGMSNGK